MVILKIEMTGTKEGCMTAWVIGGAVGGGGKRYGKRPSSGCGCGEK